MTAAPMASHSDPIINDLNNALSPSPSKSQVKSFKLCGGAVRNKAACCLRWVKGRIEGCN